MSFVGMAQLDDVTAIATPLDSRSFAAVSKGYTVFRNRDLLVAKITPCFQNGKIGKAVLDEEIGVGSTEFHVVRPGPEIDEAYLLHFLRRPEVRKTGELRMTGSGGQRRVPADFLQKLEVPLPPLEEQRLIAAILDRADALRARRRQVLAHLDDLAQSLFAQLAAPPAENTERVQLSELTVLITKGTTPSSVGLNLAQTGIPFLRAQNLQGGTVKIGADALFIDAAVHAELKRSTIRAGDVLVTIAGTIGRVAIAPKNAVEMNCNQAIAIVRLADAEMGPWIAAWLQSPDAKQQIANSSVTATIANLSLSQVGRLKVPVVARRTQIQFASQLDQINLRRRDVELAIAADDELFASLQQRGFRGEL